MNYYINRWENIAGTHYMLHDTHMGKFSYIFDNNEYVVKPDHKLIFFNLTGISYQIIELLHELIKICRWSAFPHESDGVCGAVGVDETTSYIEDYKYWLKHDDELYSILSKKIMSKMTKTKSLLI